MTPEPPAISPPPPASPLGRLIADLIRLEGPIGLDRYMALALGHPIHGYYMTRDPLGAAGDFTTAPEISQMFGELIGLWAAEVWRQMGSPAPLRLVEFGPGRGTLLADLLRAAKVVPDFRAALDLHLVETSPVLRDWQAAVLASSGVPHRWHDGLGTVPDGPLLAIANEFVDALPVRHYQCVEGRWRERQVGLDDNGRFMFGLAPDPDARLTLEAPEGSLLEVAPAARRFMEDLARRVATNPGAALIIDYGYPVSGFGETLQAVHRHIRADPLSRPGEVDLTAHVDFAALARTARLAGAAVHGPVTQGAFLTSIGIESRAAQLRSARPERAEAVLAARDRLIETRPEQTAMGALFKALALTAPDAPAPPGF